MIDGTFTGRAGMNRASARPAVLAADECWLLLRRHDLGRLSLVIDGWPRIFPVNFAAGQGAIVFRSEPGAKLRHGPGARACFEVDGFDERSGYGWSVMAIGTLEDITRSDDERGRKLRQLPVLPVAPGEKTHWLALTPEEVSGRSFQGGWVVPGRYLG